MSITDKVPTPDRLLTLNFPSAPTRLYRVLRNEINHFAASLCLELCQGGLEAYGFTKTDAEYRVSGIAQATGGQHPDERVRINRPTRPPNEASPNDFAIHAIELANYKETVNALARLKGVLVNVLGEQIVKNMVTPDKPLQD